MNCTRAIGVCDRVLTHVAEGVLVKLSESAQQLCLAGVFVGHQEGHERFAVRPPQLHAPLQLLRNTKQHQDPWGVGGGHTTDTF